MLLELMCWGLLYHVSILYDMIDIMLYCTVRELGESPQYE